MRLQQRLHFGRINIQVLAAERHHIAEVQTAFSRGDQELHCIDVEAHAISAFALRSEANARADTSRFPGSAPANPAAASTRWRRHEHSRSQPSRKAPALESPTARAHAR